MAQKKAARSKRKSTKKSSGGRKRSSAGNEVREEMHHLKQGEHKSRKQAIAIGLSKARRKGKSVPAPKKGASRKSTTRRRS
jgi:hypothetical protein